MYTPTFHQSTIFFFLSVNHLAYKIASGCVFSGSLNPATSSLLSHRFFLENRNKADVLGVTPIVGPALGDGWKPKTEIFKFWELFFRFYRDLEPNSKQQLLK
jgi:hypothetical protein